MRCGGLFETAESNGALRCFFLFSRCDILVVATRWRECLGGLLPASLDLLRHLRVTYGADFAEQMAGAVEVGRTIAPRKEQQWPGKGSSANWPLLSKAPCSSLSRPSRGTPLKLVSMLLQVTLNSMELVWGSRT